MIVTRPNSIFGRIFLTALLPILLLALLLSTYAINTRLDDLQAAHADRGAAKAEQLASLAVVGLFTGDASMLRAACHRVLASSGDIQRVVVRDRNNAVVADVQRPGADARTPSLVAFGAPVVAPVLEIDDTQQGGTDTPLGDVAVYLSAHATELARQRALRDALLISLISVALAVLLTVAVARQIVRPIDALRDAVGRIRSGDLDARISALSRGELGELQSGFNAMAEQIATSSQNLRDQIDEATVSLRDALAELEQKNADLEIARHRERDANRAKSVFLASMSHEIRTPMNGVLGFAGLLRKSELDATQREFVETIIRSANNLLAIINDILDFSEMEAGKLQLERVVFDPRDAIEDVVCLLTPQAHEKRLELIQLVDTDVPQQLVGDVTRLRHVLTNLIGNAVKFTDDGEVVVHARRATGEGRRFELEILVRDTGIGIGDEAMATLFRPFYQGPASTRRLYGGTGLGLSISHSLVEAMGGTIDVASEPGRGTCFTVHLPFDVERRGTKTVPLLDVATRSQIIVIDAHPLSGDALARTLEQAGFGVELRSEVPPPTAALLPDLWVLRCSASIDEAGVVAMLKALRRVSHAPVCVLLPNADATLKHAVEQCKGCCAQGYPVRRKRLLATLHSATGHVPIDEPKRAVDVDENAPWLSGRVVLIADDNDINLRLTDTLLRSYGARTLLAADGEAAIRLAAQNAVDLLLVDIHMPEKSGVEVARTLRAQARYRATPIIALTADIRLRDQRDEAKGLFDAWLEKPLREDKLHTAIGRSLSHEAASPATTAAETSLRDSRLPARDRANAIENTGGDPAVADALFVDLMARLPRDLEAIHAQFGERDWSAMQQSVHKLHGAAMVCGVPALSATLRALDRAVQQQATDVTVSQLARLQSEADRLVVETSRSGRAER